MSTSIAINTTDIDTGDKKQKSVSYIDPQASSQALINFAQGMVSLMANTNYESTKIYRDLNMNILPYGTFISAYMKLWSDLSKQ